MVGWVKALLIAGLLPALLPLAAAGKTVTVYRCMIRGTLTYAGHPCGPDATKMEIPDNRIGGRFDLNLPPLPAPKPPAKPPPPAQSPRQCPAGYINSTELNSLRIDRKVYPGMSEEQVKAILGSPDHINKEGWWVYMYQYWVTGRYLFVDGCLQAVQ